MEGMGAGGALHGVPISVKDCIDVRGCDSTCGTAARTFRPAEEDALIVAVLRDAGAIPIVRGSTGQSMMLPESSNAVWGTAKNPHNPLRTPGGSSGGDAALVRPLTAPYTSPPTPTSLP